MLRIQRELQVTRGAVLVDQHLALSKLDDVCSCRDRLEDVEEQLDLATEKVISTEA